MLARVTRGFGPLVAVIVVALVGGMVVAGCRTLSPEVDQRTSQGPTAKEMFVIRMMAQTGREPTFEERRQWDGEIEDRIGAYLRAHPEKASALDVSTFRFLRQAAVGMDKEQISILLGSPIAVSEDPAHLEELARRHWPVIQGNAKEAWVYPAGWRLFFSGQNLVDMTQYVPPQS